jgi:hypothetical protein
MLLKSSKTLSPRDHGPNNRLTAGCHVDVLHNDALLLQRHWQPRWLAREDRRALIVRHSQQVPIPLTFP